MKDKDILRIYMEGFNDELDGKFDQSKVNPNIDGRAYNLGSLHAIVGDDCKSVDNLSNEQILEILRKKVKRTDEKI